MTYIDLAMSQPSIFESYEYDSKFYSMGVVSMGKDANRSIRLYNLPKFKIPQKIYFESYDYSMVNNKYDAYHYNPMDIPRDRLYKYSVAISTINRVLYPSTSFVGNSKVKF